MSAPKSSLFSSKLGSHFCSVAPSCGNGEPAFHGSGIHCFTTISLLQMRYNMLIYFPEEVFAHTLGITMIWDIKDFRSGPLKKQAIVVFLVIGRIVQEELCPST